jgi:hypothetical protein
LLSALSDLGTVASIVGLVVSVLGLGISIWVLVNTFKLKAEFRLFIGLPRLVNKLGENASNLTKLSRKFNTSPHLIDAELSRIEANVESVKEKDKRTEVAVQHVQLAIKVYRESPSDLDRFWKVHGQLLGLIEKIKNTQQDRLEER